MGLRQTLDWVIFKNSRLSRDESRELSWIVVDALIPQPTFDQVWGEYVESVKEHDRLTAQFPKALTLQQWREWNHYHQGLLKEKEEARQREKTAIETLRSIATLDIPTEG